MFGVVAAAAVLLPAAATASGTASASNAKSAVRERRRDKSTEELRRNDKFELLLSPAAHLAENRSPTSTADHVRTPYWRQHVGYRQAVEAPRPPSGVTGVTRSGDEAAAAVGAASGRSRP